MILEERSKKKEVAAHKMQCFTIETMRPKLRDDVRHAVLYNRNGCWRARR